MQGATRISFKVTDLGISMREGVVVFSRFRWALRKGFRIVLICLIFLSFTPVAVSAKQFPVNTGFDLNDLNLGDGNCVAFILIIIPAVNIFCTLRAAVEEANVYPGEDTINLPSGFFRFQIDGRDEDAAISGDLDITESLIIRGKGGSNTIIDAKQIDRVFDIFGEDTTVTIRDLTILNGEALADGGAVRNEGNLYLENVVLLNSTVMASDNKGQGGILYNNGMASIVQSTLQGGKSFEGGAVFNDRKGLMSILSSTISNNNAANGSGISNYGFMSLTNSTISENGNNGTLFGGGILNYKDIVLQHVTIANNMADNGGGISNWSSIKLQNTLVANNTGMDCNTSDSIISSGYNLDSDTTCSLEQQTDITGVDAGLENLQNNGGLTRTHNLSRFSPARDSGLAVDGIGYDQRGVARPFGKGVDIGSVENNSSVISPMLTPLILSN